jgi:hypothetical protein
MMNRGVMQRQMFSNGGESIGPGSLRADFVGRKSQEMQRRMVQRAKDILLEIEFLMGKLPIEQKEALLRQPNSVLENTLTQVREKYGKDELLDRMNLREIDNYVEEINRKYDEMLAQDREFDIAPSAQQAIPSDMLMRGGRRDPNMTEQMGINPLTRMQQLQNDQMVSAGRPTPNILNPEYDRRGQVGNIPAGRRESVPENFGGVNQQISMKDDLDYLREKRINQGKVNEGYAAGGEAVPNKFKGFSKLPESVQMQMNPSLAKKYQQGGIASMMDPASMPQGDPMMGGQMDPAQIAMMEAEAAGQAQGEQIGAMVGEQTMMGLDQAEDFQGAIDALRGNSAPLEARYQELAGFVGDQDAMQTPESVLAMVQPTIMMTEQGAVDSGIGQLMQQITGNVEMETPDGQPTAMAEGVGSLMGVGQQPAEKKLLADGGAVGLVPAYQSAGEVSYDDILKRFQAVSGDPQARKDALQSDILFNIADRGLAFAGGVDPRTGENMAGAPLLSQLGRAGAGLGATIGEKLASNRALDQQLRTAALTETLSQEKEGRARSDAFSLASMKSAAELEKQKIINAGKLSEIGLKSKLDTQSKMTIEQLKQDGRIDLAKFNLSGDESLEKLKQLGALTLEEYKQANRTALEGTLQQNREALEALRQTGRSADMIQADKLEKQNIQIRADLELNKLNVANEYEIDIIDRRHDQAVEINNTNNALQKELANVTNRLKERDVQVRENAEDRQLVNDSLNRLLEERRVKVSEFNAKISAAQAQEKIDLTKARDAFNQTSTLNEQDLNERKLLLEKDKLALDKFEGEEKVRLEEEKLALEAAASKFNKYGKALGATTIAIVSNPDLLQKYGNNTLTEEDGISASEMSAFLTKYNQPTMDWSEEKKAFVRKEGLALTDEMLDAIKLRKENGLSFPKLKGVSEIQKPEKEPNMAETFTSNIMKGIDNPEKAFGSPAVFKSFLNKIVEAGSLGYFQAPADEAKRSIKAIDNLNAKALQDFQKAAELRDSVFQAQIIQNVLPQANQFFTGYGDAIASTKSFLGRIDDELNANVFYLESNKVPSTSKQYREMMQHNVKLRQLKAGYEAILKADNYGKKFQEDKVDEASKILFGEEIKSDFD